MNKSALIEQIAKRSELPISQSRKALDAILETITEALANGDRVQLVGFGLSRLPIVSPVRAAIQRLVRSSRSLLLRPHRSPLALS